MKPVRLVLQLGLCAVFLAPAAQAADAAVQADNAVLKIYSTLRYPDPYRPWSKQSGKEVTGSGVVIEGHRILTNAHVVGYASQVQVQANGGGDKLDATVEAIAPGIDLAVLKLEDESFFNTHPALPRASVLPDVKEPVMAYGYPTGGNSLSITKGIVSRIEFAPYRYPVSGLRIQIDAPINPGNSGGPVLAGDRMIGLAYSMAANAQNIGYIIPNEEIDLFLKDIADGRYDGKPALFDVMQTLENPALRTYLKLDKGVEGMVVSRPVSGDPSYPLKEWDVITHIAGTPIDNQGMVRIGPNLRVRFFYLVQKAARDGKVALTVVRDGKSLTLQVPTPSDRPLLIPELKGAYPSYFIYGPLVFSRATGEFLSAISANAQTLGLFSVRASPLVTRRADLPDARREELVVIAAPFFPHRLVAGYSNRFSSVIESVNGIPIRSLRHLVATLRDLKDPLVTLRFDEKPSETIVLPRAEMMAATEGILSDNGIRAQGSSDMMAVWEGHDK